MQDSTSHSDTIPKSRFCNQATFLHTSRLVDPLELHAPTPYFDSQIVKKDMKYSSHLNLF